MYTCLGISAGSKADHLFIQICSGRWFEDEDEEVREMSQRLFPDIKLIMVPSDLKLEAASDQDIVDYLKEQVESWKKE